ncbi:MAG: 3-keto-disaccharide hydrolase [Planctomycetota bacterium]|jgi:hypothetical protein
MKTIMRSRGMRMSSMRSRGCGMVKPVIAGLVVLGIHAVARAHESMDTPVITTETKVIRGKKAFYMYIDGVKVHEADETKQPQPKVVAPATAGTEDRPGKAPSDAVVLFDGTKETFANWTDRNGGKTRWVLSGGALMPTRKSGYIQSKQKFGSCQLHIEWASPKQVKGSGQGRGNSGVFLMSNYEVQVLDSFKNKTYPDGQAGALYGRAKPLVNACRGPGEWQAYDIVFHRPLFDNAGKVTRRATFTVFHNGVLIHDHVRLSGGTGWRGPHAASDYRRHPDKLPLQLQDHSNPVRFRNIWVRELED